MAMALLVPLIGAVHAKAPPRSKSDLRIPHQRYFLTNGLEIILAHNPRLPRVSVNLRYKVGSSSDEKGRAGAAHLYEHLYVFSPVRKATVRLEEIGATQIGATTEFDRTTYYTTVPAVQLEAVLAIESERMRDIGVLIDEPLLARERKAVRNERRLVVENRAYGMADETIFYRVFPPGHIYNHLYIGRHADIQSVSLKEARDFFRRYYTPNNAILTIAGDLRTDNVRGLIEHYFGRIGRGPPVLPRTETMPTAMAGYVIVPDDVSESRLSFAWQGPANYRPGSYETDILAVILGHGESSRLHKRLVGQEKLSKEVYAYNYNFMEGSAFVINVAMPSDRKSPSIEPIINDEIKRLLHDGPTESELARALNTLEMRMIRGLERNGDIIDRSGLTHNPTYGGISEQLSECSHLTGRPDCISKTIDSYRQVSAHAIKALAKSLFAGNRVVVLAVPGKKIVDDPPAPAADIVGAVGPDTVSTPRMTKVTDRPSNLRHAMPRPRVQKLANGLTIFHLPVRDAAAATVMLVAKGGTKSTDRPGLAAFATEMLTRGTRRRSGTQVTYDAAQLGATLESDINLDAIALRISVQRSNLPAALDLLSDVARSPTFPTDSVEDVRHRRLDRIAQALAAPDIAAGLTFTRTLYGDANPEGSGGVFNDVLFARQHPYGYEDLGTSESLQAVSREDLITFHHMQFVPKNAALIVSGNIDEREVRQLAMRYFGTWKGGPRPTRVVDVRSGDQQRSVLIETGARSQTIIRIGRVFPKISDEDALALRLANIVFGEVYASRITTNLRERRGITYMARSRVSSGHGNGLFSVGTSVKAEATGVAVKEIMGEISRLGLEPISTTELRFARSYFENSLLDRFETSTAAVTSISDLFVYDLPVQHLALLPARAHGLSAAAISEAAKRYLVPSKMTVIAIGPADAIREVEIP